VRYRENVTQAFKASLNIGKRTALGEEVLRDQFTQVPHGSISYPVARCTFGNRRIGW